MASPTLQLSVGGVHFNLVPKEGETGAVKFQQEGEQVSLNFTSFTGTLRVVKDPAAVENTERVNQVSPRNESETPVNPTKRDLQEEGTPQPTKRQRQEDDEETSLPPVQTPEEPIVEEERESPEDVMSQDLLAQPDLSQTQPSSFPSEEMMESGDSNQATVVPEAKSNIQELMEKQNQACSPGPLSQQSIQSSVKSIPAFISHDGTNQVIASPHSVPARVSLGSSPAVRKKTSNPPCPRWGHTMTHIGSDRLLVYGGQALDEQGVPKTMNDLTMFNTKTREWFKPYHPDALSRQWHTATYIPNRSVLISFGGESTNPKTGRTKPVDKVMVLDTELMLWYPPAVSGDIPSGRSGHTATLLPETNDLVVFGGVKGSKWLNSVSVLDTSGWHWRAPKIQGSAPKPRSYHTATSCSGGRIVIFGGNDATASFDSLHVLETAGEKWRWTNIQASGKGPSPRTGHSATVLADNKTICFYGGWDPNGDEETQQVADDGDLVFDETFLLDTDKWEWTKGPPAIFYGDMASESQGECCSAKRVGHTAALSNDKSQVLIFGGRVPCDEFAGDFQSITLK